MLNQCILVGRVIKVPNEETPNVITISITRRGYQEATHVNEVDEIDIELSDSLNATISEHIRLNATLGVKARIHATSETIGNSCIKRHKIIAEKLTFIQSNNDSE